MQHPVSFTPTMSAVQARFADWRKNKKDRRRIPEDLWEAAVLLNNEYSLNQISSALRLGYSDLKKRIKSHKQLHACKRTPSQDFISIDMPQVHSAECVIEMEHISGNKMRMHFKGKADLDLQSFAESFWRGL